MSSQTIVNVKGRKMTKYEKELKKKDDAEEAWTTFVNNIMTISRNLVQEIPGTNETLPICKVILHQRFHMMIVLHFSLLTKII